MYHFEEELNENKLHLFFLSLYKIIDLPVMKALTEDDSNVLGWPKR